MNETSEWTDSNLAVSLSLEQLPIPAKSQCGVEQVGGPSLCFLYKKGPSTLSHDDPDGTLRNFLLSIDVAKIQNHKRTVNYPCTFFCDKAVFYGLMGAQKKCCKRLCTGVS